MKPYLFLGLLLAMPAAAWSERIYSNRVYRSDAPVQRVTTVRTTTTSPSIEVYRDWDRRHDYLWDQRRYHWDGTAWIVLPGVTYTTRGGFGTSSTLQDDVGEDRTHEDVTVTRTVTRSDLAAPALSVDVQRRLARRGYYHGPIDGIVGPGTRSAIAAFQADNGLEQNGLMTRETVVTLGL